MFARATRDSDDDRKPRREEMVRGHALEERRVTAWVGASIVINGNLTSSEDITVAGQVEGDVTVREHTLIVAPRARIRGSITARTVVVQGEVMGTINAERKVEVGETGSVNGDIVAPRMQVVEGATLQGQLRMARSSPGSS